MRTDVGRQTDGAALQFPPFDSQRRETLFLHILNVCPEFAQRIDERTDGALFHAFRTGEHVFLSFADGEERGEEAHGCAGTVDVIVSTHEYMPASATVAEVQALMDENREVCTDVLVRTPQTVPIGVAATVTAKAGQSQKLICDNVKIALQKYFVGERLGRDVLRSELEEIIASVSGVASYVLIQPEEDFLIDPNELPVIGAITVTGGEA